jgi:hypothetical protein
MFSTLKIPEQKRDACSLPEAAGDAGDAGDAGGAGVVAGDAGAVAVVVRVRAHVRVRVRARARVRVRVHARVRVHVRARVRVRVRVRARVHARVHARVRAHARVRVRVHARVRVLAAGARLEALSGDHSRTSAICGGATGSIELVPPCCISTDSLVCTFDFRRGDDLIEKVACEPDAGPRCACVLH